MASFIARMFGGGKKEEAPKPAPAPTPVKQEPVVQPKELPRAKTTTKYGGIQLGINQEAKVVKKMLLGE